MNDNSTNDFESRLTSAMRPVDAPQGFATKIMDLTLSPAQESQPPARVISMRPRFVFPRLQLWAAGAIAAALLVGTFTAEQIHERQQREQAQQQFDAAMRITDHALDQTRARLERSGIRLQ
jgi:hypothetical protein